MRKAARPAPALTTLLLLALLPVPVLADETDVGATPVSAEDRGRIVERIATLLVESYVFEDVGRRCGEHLRAELAAGRLDAPADATAFAAALTEALQSVSHDKHLRVRVRRPQQVELDRLDPVHAQAAQLRDARRDNFGFVRVERLEGNVGYLDLRGFSGLPQARDTAAAAMGFLADSDALIFDLRKNGGGSPEMIRFLSSYLFAAPTHLNSLYFRPDDRTTEFWTLAEVPGRRMADVPVFVLTSSYTFSGAEEFSYNLRTRERATLVGETTGGGANPGGVFPIDERFGIFVPSGRAINPITGTNWEGVGVEPHVKVPADQALDVALERAKAAAEAHRAALDAADDARWASFDAAQARVRELHAKGDDAAAAAALREALGAALESGLIAEVDVNFLGYAHLSDHAVALAIAAFELNAERFPDSSNVHDSLGEAYMAAGRTAEATASYRRSLELDPRNQNAVAMLERLVASGG